MFIKRAIEHPLEQLRVQKQISDISDAIHARFRFVERDPSYENEDLRSEVMEKLLRHLDCLTPTLLNDDAALQRFLNVVVLNVARSKLRKINRRPARVNADDIEVFQLRDPRPGPEKACACVELQRLSPAKTRSAIELRWQGYTFQEIGDQLGCSHTAARNAIKKGLQVIKRLLKGRHGGA